MLWILLLFSIVGCVEGECPGEDLSLAPRPFSEPESLPVCEILYRAPNCTCPSSMFECACHKFGRCGDKPGCIDTSKVNDWNNDCMDWSDEFGDICPVGRFQCVCFNTTCKSRFGCVKGSSQCNGIINCPDGSDEFNCTCPADKFQCHCRNTNHCTKQKNGQSCITKKQQCNGHNDCGDWSDEINCTCPADKFECSSKPVSNFPSQSSCIAKTKLCDGWNDCGDWSDEFNCTCPAHKFKCDCYKAKNCTGYANCIGKTRLCNGENDCGDWSDELNCTNCNVDYNFECACYKTNNCSSSIDSGCISRGKQCNGRNDCGDWSDEIDCNFLADKFRCDCHKNNNCTVKGLFPKIKQCDGLKNCEDWSDEVNCTCPADKFECACVRTKQCIGMKGSCVDRSMLCDGNRDCFDGSDETHHTCNCSGVYARCPCASGNKHCPSTGRCIPFNWIGDDIEDCIDGSDKLCASHNITCKSCSMLAMTCKSKILVRHLVHSTVPAVCNSVVQHSCADDINSCGTEKVICVFSQCAEPPDYFCHNLFICKNQQLILNDYFCDRTGGSGRGCNDKSDENEAGFGFKCSGSSRKGVCVLPQANVYDSVAQCSDKSDLCFVNGQFRCFKCLDKKLIISPKQVCDGIVDCFDMSDECLCPNQSLCDKIRGDCPPNQMHCYNSTMCVSQVQTLCNSSLQCADQINTKYCSKLKNSRQGECLPKKVEGLGLDEIFKCAKTDHARLRNQFQYYLSRGFKAQDLINFICDGSHLDVFGPVGEAHCPNTFRCFYTSGFSLKNTQVCDGKVDCYDGSDEFYSLCHETQYYCKSDSWISINRKTLCDGITDCDNESDESICLCEKKRFYCTNKQPLSIDIKLVQNGIRDCSDGSDECVNLVENPFADVNEMIFNPFYRAIFWIMALLALGGNSFVFVATIRSLQKANKDQNVLINTNVFVLNLSVSDFLMGIYLLVVIVQATRFSGSYCLFDKEWRSSSLCSGLGALAVLSSEASALTMTTMTTFRLASAFKPFAIRSVDVRRVLIAEVFCWILSILLANIPLLDATSEYFVTDVWFPNYFFGSDFVSRKNMSLLAERITNVKPESWNEVKQTINKAFPQNTVQGEFGYYGETSVCMPRLFATTSEFAWEYSTFLITINFLMFIYMVIAYFLIYKQSNRMKGSRSTDVSSKMQKRISRLIVTDFCCWIPICVMGYLSVGGIKMPPDAYVLSACLLLPINSALNPLLYSKAFEDQLFEAMKFVRGKMSTLRAYSSRSSDLAVIYNAQMNEEGEEVIEIIF